MHKLIERNDKGQFKKGCNKLYASDNPFYGYKHSTKTRQQMSIKRIGRTPALGKKWTMGKQGRENISKAKMGIKNPAWKGGINTIKERLYYS